jgi:Zn finger protein HypA/HybF involved in hydrogenase expression
MHPKWIGELESAVKTSRCKTEVVGKLGLSTKASGNFQTVDKWIKKLNLDISHFNFMEVVSEKSKIAGASRKLSHDEIFKQDSHCSNNTVVRAFKKISDYECALCGNDGFHRNLSLTLQLDHINGNRTDNRIENLRWLCPNCHSQTETFGSRRFKRIVYCVDCGKEIRKKSVRCYICNQQHSKNDTTRRKVVRPTKEELSSLLRVNSWRTVGKMFGVSDNAVRSWALSYNILEKPL